MLRGQEWAREGGGFSGEPPQPDVEFLWASLSSPLLPRCPIAAGVGGCSPGGPREQELSWALGVWGGPVFGCGSQSQGSFVPQGRRQVLTG